jgi:hypothetical protein
MSSSEVEVEGLELASITGTPKNKIVEIYALKTIQAYKDAYREKGVVPTSLEDFPSSEVGYQMARWLLEFDRLLVPETIKKVIRSMVIQPISKDGKRKYALYYTGSYVGENAMGLEFDRSAIWGWYYKPKLQPFFSNTGLTKYDFNEDGTRRATWKAVGQTIEHDIFVPEDP